MYKILQIISAGDWCYLGSNDYGKNYGKKIDWAERLICFALIKEEYGNTVVVGLAKLDDDDNQIQRVDIYDWFMGYRKLTDKELVEFKSERADL